MFWFIFRFIIDSKWTTISDDCECYQFSVCEMAMSHKKTMQRTLFLCFWNLTDWEDQLTEDSGTRSLSRCSESWRWDSQLLAQMIWHQTMLKMTKLISYKISIDLRSNSPVRTIIEAWIRFISLYFREYLLDLCWLETRPHPMRLKVNLIINCVGGEIFFLFCLLFPMTFCFCFVCDLRICVRARERMKCMKERENW